ncbi:MAG: tetratricopeptide repeat protein [Acidimicrobiia bacterium]
MTERTELEEERRFLLDSLRDLEREHDEGDIDEGDYESLRDDYTARAAEVLRALEAYEDRDEPDGTAADRPAGTDRPVRRRPATRARVAAAAPPASRHSGSRRTLATVLILGFLLVAGTSVFVMSGNREPGAPATGSLPDTPQGDLQRAHELDAQGQGVEALKLYDRVLAADPANVEALTYRGWLLKRAGLPDDAQASLDRAIAINPAYPDAHFFKGMLLYQDRRDPAAAIPEFEKYLASNPPAGTVEAVQGVLDRARADVAAATPAPPAE